MEKQSVFEHLAERFSQCQVEIRRGKTPSDGDIPDLMLTAGKALFDLISSKAIDLGDTPDWFRNKPERKRTDYDDNELVYHSWDLYWLYTIKWLAKNRLDSGITFPGGILRVPVEESLHSGHDITDHLMGLLRLRGEHLKNAWRRLAKASEDACSYLASNDVRAKKPAEGYSWQRSENSNLSQKNTTLDLLYFGCFCSTAVYS